jgi:hypothetical protein
MRLDLLADQSICGPGGDHVRHGAGGVPSWRGDDGNGARSATVPPWLAMLDRYRAAWAEANPIAIIDATAPGYRFHDPLVGLFTRWSVPQYFDRLQTWLAAAGPSTPSDLAFRLRGPMDGSTSRLRLRFWREAPCLGLTGIAEIQIGERGVIAETVAYDLNLAADLLRRACTDLAS